MSIHPTAIIEEEVQLGAGCVVHAYAVVKRHSVLGDGVIIHPFAVIGGDPQYLKFDPATKSGVRVGAGTVIREHVTINRSIHAGQATTVGARCFLMANSHVGHDSAVADDVVLANNVMLAGHVTVGGHTFLGGGAGFHQFCRVGEGVIVSGLARIAQDIPPFTMAAERNEVIGLNLVGLKRRGFSRETIREIKDAFRAVYFTSGNIRAVARASLEGGAFKSAEARQFLTFFTEGKRGFARARREGLAGEDDAG
ncbi:MAG: acyl-ACP--UDP-N-acetylglucosamine O-acyltransferase [bacterium]|nr:acyl-ACP--UDP-N-acetylglucosamine O-acyltransferase [bacterium]MDI1336501.1 acyl-ACP--UDP-N-acetylglucosamine O-acyltransferase [Lacunisphaera sp.]